MEDSELTTEKEEHSVIALQNKAKEDNSSIKRPNGPVRVAICDLSPTIRCGLQQILNADSNIEIVLTATSQAEVIDKAGRLNIDVIQVDIDDEKETGL